MENTNKVVKNTIYLYLKIIISLCITLLSTRIILKSLGTEDFGIFNLIAGVIGMLAFLNGAMTVTTQRYLSYHLGKGEPDKNRNVFKTSVLLHLIIGITLVCLLEIGGVFLFDGFLNLPQARIGESKILFHFMVISTFFTVNAVPYDAAINANEDMLFDSMVSILEAILKLIVAYYILFTTYDKLIVYGLLIAILTILIRVIKTLWCYFKYYECSFDFKVKYDFKLLKEMSIYASWNLFGAIAYVANNQGLAIILNRFFGAKINASYGITNQVNSQMLSFSIMMVKAFNPQIVKSEGASDRNRMMRLAIQSSKFSTFLLLIMVIPIVLELPFILKLWLVHVPDYTVVFCVIVLANSIISQMSTGLKTAVQAIGKIKLYQFIIGTTIFLVLPVSYISLLLGFPPYSVLVCSLIVEIIALIIRLKIVNYLAGLSIKDFMINLILKVLIIAVLSLSISYYTKHFFTEGLFRVLVVFSVSTLSTLLLIWYYGLINDERETISKMINKLRSKVFK